MSFNRSQIVRFTKDFTFDTAGVPSIQVPATTRAKVVHEKNGTVKVTIHDQKQKDLSGQKVYVPSNILTRAKLGRPTKESA